MKLRELVEGCNATGVIRIDDGNGSAGAAWISWDDDINNEFGDIEMFPVSGSDRAYEGDDEYANKSTFAEVAHYALDDYDTGELYASDWIVDGTGDNPYRFRLII